MYDEIIYHLDLSIMAYHLFAQTLIWPWDPFYEKMRLQGSSRREKFMDEVRKDLLKKPKNNSFCHEDLDPILSDYSRLNPTKGCIFKPDGGTKWECFSPIDAIVGNIGKGFLVTYSNVVGASPIIGNSIVYNTAPTAKDTIYYIEGITGLKRKSEPIDKGQKTIIAFILVNHYDPNDNTKYNIHIAFRGSRSGNAIKAGYSAIKNDKGNPDWVTDLQIKDLESEPEICPVGKVPYGFAIALKEAMPNIIAAFKHIKTNQIGAPNDIYSTGHSLGGALAALFACSLFSNWPKYNTDLPDWKDATKRIRVITFGCPVLGNEEMINYFNRMIYCRRVKVNIDPITTTTSVVVGDALHGGLKIETTANAYGPIATSNHNYAITRDKLIKYFNLTGSVESTYKPILEYKNFSEIPLTFYNFRALKLSKNDTEIYECIDSYFKLAAINLALPSSYKRVVTESTLLRRKNYIENILNNEEFNNQKKIPAYTIDNISFQLAIDTKNEDDIKWKNFIVLACIFSQIYRGVNLNFASSVYVDKIMPLI